jgi:tetratricopeptide (TPR) repeat protein
MERTKYFIIIIFGLFIPLLASATWKTEIYKAYIGNNMPGWKVIIDKMDREKNKSKDFILEMVNYQYGYIAYCIGIGKKEEAEKYLDLAFKNLEILEKQNFKPSEISAYKSAFYGYQIGLNKMKAPVIGPKSLKYSKLSMEQDPQNPMGYIQYGNSQFYMPAIFGGSKKEALVYFMKAEKLMEKEKLKLENDWNYLSLLALIGQSYTELEEFQKAKIYFEKALAVEPDYLFVKIDLLPALLKKMSTK